MISLSYVLNERATTLLRQFVEANDIKRVKVALDRVDHMQHPPPQSGNCVRQGRTTENAHHLLTQRRAVIRPVNERNCLKHYEGAAVLSRQPLWSGKAPAY